jgi:hypothetical protein
MHRTLLIHILLAPLALAAQGSAIPLQDPAIKRAMEQMQTLQAWTLDQQVSICEVPAPPFKEARRAEEFRKRLVGFGYDNTRIDSEGNVIAEIGRGQASAPTVMIAGHLDTVFPEETDVRTTRVGDRVNGPGIGDDCRGLAVVLTLAKVLKDAKVEPAGRVYLVGNVGEEGPGNLRGVRHLLTRSSPAASTTSSRWMEPGWGASPRAPSAATATPSRSRVPAGTAMAPSGWRTRCTRWAARSRRSPTSRSRPVRA